MKTHAVCFDLTRFGGVRPLITTDSGPPTPPERVNTEGPGPSGPSGPSEKPFLIDESENDVIAHMETTIGITGTTRTSGTTAHGLMPRPAFRYAAEAMVFGDICAGWSPASWAAELRRKAGTCDAYRPDIAENYRRWAADIEAKL